MLHSVSRGRAFRARVRGVRFPLVFLSAVLLAGCQSTLSLEEAKKVTATFEGKGFVPPPRTINDITAILDEQKLTNPEDTEKRYRIVNSTPPKDADGPALARFFKKRGSTARGLGLDTQALQDLRQAAKFMEGTGLGSKEKADILRDLANAEKSTGNFMDGLKYLERSIQINPDRATFMSLIWTYAAVGDLEAMERAWKQGQRIIASTRTRSAKDAAWKTIFSELQNAAYFQALGKHRKSEQSRRVVIDTFTEKIGDTYEGAYINFLSSRLNELAGSLKKQGRLVEAEVVTREALLEALGRGGRNSKHTGNAVRLLASVLDGQGRFAEAEKLIRSAIDIFERSGMSPKGGAMFGARKVLAGILVSKQDWAGALEEYEELRKILKDNKKLLQKWVLQSYGYNIALYKSGNSKLASELLLKTHELKKIRLGSKHIHTAKIGALLAMTRAELGEKKAALSGFGESLPILLSRSRQSDSEETSEGANNRIKSMVLDRYISLLADIQGTPLEQQFGIDAVAEAFRTANSARGQTVQRALAASSARATADNPELADIARREQDARKQIATFYAVLADALGKPTDQQIPAAIKSLRGTIDQLRGARAALMEEIEARFPDYAALIDPKPATIELARSILRPGEALISTYVGKDKTYVWAIPREGEVAFTAAEIGEDDLADRVAILRSSLEPNSSTLADIPDFDVAAAHDLYELLFEPVKAGWRKADSLLVVAHGPLGYLPLSVLPTEQIALEPDKEGQALFSNHRDVPWLARSHAVTMLPSVMSLKILRSLPAGTAGRKSFAGFGDPYFSIAQEVEAKARAAEPAEIAELTSRGLRTRALPVRLRAAPKTGELNSAGLAQLPRLPDTSDEIRSIAVALKADLTKDVFIGKKANEGMVKSVDLSGYKVLAFATHGLVPGDLNGLHQPALALSAPEVTGTEGDGLLTMDEILGLRLDADWVVLSACNTGTGNGAGAEAVSGLGRAFFYAGTRALLVSNWPVETTSAKALTTDLFRRQKADPSLTRAQALRRTMLGLIDGPGYVDEKLGKTVFSYAHPIFWAPFSLIGDGGGGKSSS